MGYGGDKASSKYSPLAQISGGNSSRLKTAWTWQSAEEEVEGANFESRMLNHLLTCILMILVLAIAAFGTRCFTEARTRSPDELLFEEEYPAEIVSLKLN
jgi:hypothetical protein